MYNVSGVVLAEKPSIGVEPTRLYDRSRFKNHGVHTNITMVQLPKGLWVRSFNGSTSKIVIPDAPSIQNIFDGGGTIGAWVKAYSDGEASQGRIFDKYATNQGWMFFVRNEGSGMMLRLSYSWDGSDAFWTLDARDIIVGTPHLVVLTYNTDSATNDPIFYVDGAVATSSENAAPSGTRDSDIGVDLNVGNSSDTSKTFDGDIALPFAKNSVLSPGQIKNIYEKQLKDWF